MSLCHTRSIAKAKCIVMAIKRIKNCQTLRKRQASRLLEVCRPTYGIELSMIFCPTGLRHLPQHRTQAGIHFTAYLKHEERLVLHLDLQPHVTSWRHASGTAGSRVQTIERREDSFFQVNVSTGFTIWITSLLAWSHMPAW